MERYLCISGLLALAGILPMLVCWGGEDGMEPRADQNLVLTAPITTWDEALPLGNGLMGGLLWGEKDLIRLSLDRGDLWDERPAVEKEWWKTRTFAKARELADKKDFGTINQWWDSPYNGRTPTKLPGGRLEITLDPAQRVERFELNLATAEGWAWLNEERKLTALFSADEPVALMRIPGAEPKAVELIPAGAKKQGSGSGGPSSGGAVAALGYPAAQHGREGTAVWYVQEAAEGLKYCVCVESHRAGDETVLAIAVTSTNDAADLLVLARQRCSAALKKGYGEMFKPHAAWWKAFWSRSSVTLPACDPEISKQYHLIQYFHGAASRRKAPPMPLQGVWTADNGGLPPWKGDYHNDLNTQMTYIAYQSAGHFDEGLSYLDYLWDRASVFRAFARDFYGTEGLACPGVMSLAGQPLGGWGQYSLSPTMSAWSAHLFYLHWRYTMDENFLKERAYPWCRDVGLCMLGLLKPDAKGVLKLPFSSSPEIFDNSARAWVTPNSNYDLMCLKMLFLFLQEMADAAGSSNDAKKWADAAAALGDFHVNDQGLLLVDATTPLPSSHRHLSNIIGLHPFNLITIESGGKDRQRIAATLAQWDQLGTSAWCGYSFSWMSCLRARVGDAEAALRNLDIFCKAFVLRNGFHVNGDQTGSGFSGFTYRPFTLEGNFLAAQAVQEMLLQSWSPTPGKRNTEVIRIFPATPWRWHDVAIRDLRAEGGHRVSARRENNATTWLRVEAGSTGEVRIRDNFGGRTPQWSIEGVKKVGDNFLMTLEKGQTVEAKLAKPDAVPAEPANRAEPVDVSSSGVIQANRLSLRIGADSNGQNRFKGDIARVLVIDRVLKLEEIASLAQKDNAKWAATGKAVVALDGKESAATGPKVNVKTAEKVEVLPADGGLAGSMLRLDGQGYLEIPHQKELSCRSGLTLAAWVRPTAAVESGARIIDKSPAGSDTGYLLDTYPGGTSLRLIVHAPHLTKSNALPLNQWTHVAATVDGKTGKRTLYVNGQAVTE